MWGVSHDTKTKTKHRNTQHTIISRWRWLTLPSAPHRHHQKLHSHSQNPRKTPRQKERKKRKGAVHCGHLVMCSAQICSDQFPWALDLPLSHSSPSPWLIESSPSKSRDTHCTNNRSHHCQGFWICLFNFGLWMGGLTVSIYSKYGMWKVMSNFYYINYNYL